MRQYRGKRIGKEDTVTGSCVELDGRVFIIPSDAQWSYADFIGEGAGYLGAEPALEVIPDSVEILKEQSK